MATQDHSNRLYGIDLSSLISFPLTLRAAIQLNVFQIIADAGPESHLSSSEIAAKLPTTNTHAPAILDRILRVLAANSALTMSRRASQPNKTEWVYGLTSGSRSLVKGEEDGVSMAPLVLLCTDKTILESFYCLEETVIEGGCTPYERAHGKDLYGYAAEDPSYNQFLQEAMSNCTTIIIKEVLKVYRGFDGVKKMVDVGGGSGTCLSLVVSKYPHIQGVNFDLPQAISLAPQFSGVEHVAGNMFEGVPSSEAIFMRGVLHNWDDDQCIKLLRNCWNALPNGGMVIDVDIAVPDPLGTDELSRSTSGFDLLMMSFCSGGKERTLSEYDDLAKAAGFAEMKAFPVVHGFHVMEFHKTHVN